MANKLFNLILDLSGQNLVPHINIRRNDYDSNVFSVQVTQNGLPFDFSGMNPIFECLTPDGHYIRDDGTQFGTINVVDATQGKLEYTLVNEIFAVLGQIDVAYFAFEQTNADLQNPTNRVSTGNFSMRVIADALTDTTAAADYMSDVTTLIQEINQLKTDYDTLNLDNFVKVVDYNANNASVTAQLADIVIDVKSFGAKGDGVTDDTAAINNAISAAISASTHFYVSGIQEDQSKPALYFPQGKYLYDNSVSPLVWDVYKFSLLAHGAILLFTSTDNTKYSIQMVSSDPWTANPYHQTTVSMEGLTLYGLGSMGIRSGNNDAGSSHISFHKIKMKGFANGKDIDFVENSYLMTFIHCEFSDGINDTASTNQGENIRFIACLLGGDPGVLLNNGNADLYFDKCSFDYSGQFINLLQGQITCRDCHFENNANGVFNSSKRPFYVGTSYNAILLVQGGNLGFSNSSQTTIDYIIENHNNGLTNGSTMYKGGAWFKDLQITSCATTSGFFATGEGNTHISGMVAKGYESNFTGINESDLQNLMIDGSFSQASILDKISTSDTVHTSWSLSTSDVYSGTQSLKVIKNSGSGINSYLYIDCINDFANKIPSITFRIKNNGCIGSFSVDYFHGFFDNSGNLVRSAGNSSSSTINWVDTGSDFYLVRMSPTFRDRVPSWANGLRLRINLFSTNGTSGYFNIGNVIMQTM